MTDRRRQGFFARWRRRFFDYWHGYWMQRGVIPRWQYLFVYVLILAVSIIGQWKTSSIADDVRENARVNTAALCALREDVAARREAAQRFLLEHPRGESGIPAATIRQSITNYGRTIEALAIVDCSSSP